MNKTMDNQKVLICVIFALLLLIVQSANININVQTMTGDKTSLQVEQGGTIKMLQEEIYKSGKTAGPVRILKGKNVLPDDSTLAAHGIIEGSTVNILIEPDQSINIEVKCGPKTYREGVVPSISVKQLKQRLIKNNQVALLPNEFDLAMVISEAESPETLVNDNFPLHFYGVKNNSVLIVVKHFMSLNIVSEKGLKFYKQFSRLITVDELKRTIALSQNFQTNFNFLMFIKGTNNIYTKLAPSMETLGNIFKDDDTIYLSMDNFFEHQYALYFNYSLIGKIGVGSPESVLSIKLRTQEQTGVPVKNIKIVQNTPAEPPVRNENHLHDGQQGGPVVSGNNAGSQGSFGGPAPVVQGPVMSGNNAGSQGSFGGPVMSSNNAGTQGSFGGPVMAANNAGTQGSVGGPVISGSNAGSQGTFGGPVMSGNNAGIQGSFGGPAPVVQGPVMAANNEQNRPSFGGIAPVSNSATSRPGGDSPDIYYYAGYGHDKQKPLGDNVKLNGRNRHYIVIV